jgi:hypothetical protein
VVRPGSGRYDGVIQEDNGKGVSANFSVGQAIYFNLSIFLPIIKRKRSSQSAIQVGESVRLLCLFNSQSESGTNKVAKTRETNYISNDIAVVYT